MYADVHCSSVCILYYLDEQGIQNKQETDFTYRNKNHFFPGDLKLGLAIRVYDCLSRGRGFDKLKMSRSYARLVSFIINIKYIYRIHKKQRKLFNNIYFNR